MSIVKSVFTRKKRHRRGFTLVELLMVVLIIGILSGITAVGSVVMYRNMKQTQLDKTAETIFHAAQDRLSELYAYGKESEVEFDDASLSMSVSTGEEGKSAKVLFVTRDVIDNSSYSTEARNAARIIMGDDTVNADVFSNSWIVEYQPETCRVLNVIYTDKEGTGLGSFGRNINALTPMADLIEDLQDHAFSSRRYKYGWYGEGTPIVTEVKQIGNTSVDVDIINEENLYAHVKVSIGWEDDLTSTEISKFLENKSLTLRIQDADAASSSAAYKDFVIPAKGLFLSHDTTLTNAGGYYNAKSDADAGSGVNYVTNKYLTASFDMLLDSLSAGAFTGSNTLKTFDGYGTGITPGSNFYLIATVASTDGSTPTVQDYDVDNSLFAGYAAGTAKKAYIEYGRHLQNVARAQITDFNAIQIADLDFGLVTTVARDTNLDEFNKYWASVYPDVDGFTIYTPENSDKLLTYDGQNHVIKNIKINRTTADGKNSGIFGDLSKLSSVRNVIITGDNENSTKVSAAATEAVGMFAAKLTGISNLEITKCYVNKVSVDGASTTSLGGFIGEISASVSSATITDCAMMSVSAGATTRGKYSGAFAGKVAGKIDGTFTGTNLYAFGGTVKASEASGGLIGYSDAAPVYFTISGCKVSGTEVTASSGNAGGIIGNANNTTITLNADCAAAGCTIRSAGGNAGGLVGGAYGLLYITDSECYMPTLSDSAVVAGKVSQEFAKAIGLTEATGETNVTYDNLHTLNVFKYVSELKTAAAVSELKWISGSQNAGGLVGVSSKDITVKHSFASGVLSSSANAGGAVGSTSGKLSAVGSYADFYISGKKVGGFVAACDEASTFDTSYTAGFLVGTADTAGGFAPVQVGNISNSYSVFNFDDVSNSTLFAGNAEEDEEHTLDTNGTVANYPDVDEHHYYPVALSSLGKAYYVYSSTDFDVDNENAVVITAAELANNMNEDGVTLLSASGTDNAHFVKGQGTGNTAPYLMASFLGDKLHNYPFPTLTCDKFVGSTASTTVLKHYNDWLIIDDSKYSIELWYMVYDENLGGLKTNVTGVGPTGMKYIKRVKAVPVTINGQTEYQINAGTRNSFSGYKFVGYFDPVTASKPLTASSAFDRTKKMDYLYSGISNKITKKMKTGDIILQTSITRNNTFGVTCADHAKIFEKDKSSTYTSTRRLYAVYRYNKPYTVSLSFVEYELPEADAKTESRTLQQIYNGSKLAPVQTFEVIYKEPGRSNYPNLASDEEVTQDYIAEKQLFDQYKASGDKTAYESALAALEAQRSTANQVITRSVPNYTEAGYDLFDIDRLYTNKLVTSEYRDNVKAKPVYTMVRISPDTKDPDGNDIEYKDRCLKIEARDDNKISMSTNKAYQYVVVYNTNRARQTLNLVFRNTEPVEDGTVPIVNSHDDLSADLAEREFMIDSSNTYMVRVSGRGFTDKGLFLDDLMKKESHPSFTGFELNTADSTYVHSSDGTETVTLYYDRSKYVLSFRLNDSGETPKEKYYDSEDRPEVVDLYYRQEYQGKLWEIASTDIEVTISGNNTSDLRNSNNIQIGTITSYGGYYYWRRERSFGSYEELEDYIRTGYDEDSGVFTLLFYYDDGDYYWDDYSWSKTGGDYTYAFNRSGFFLSGFKYYHEDSDGSEHFNGRSYSYAGEVKTVNDILTMPAGNVMVEPIWTQDPKHLRVEIYYQSAYDDVSAEDPNKEYEFYNAMTYDVTNGVATTRNRNKISISALVASVNKSLVDYLEPYFAAGDFYKRTEHNLTGTGFNPYVSNEANSVRYGYPHDSGNDTMVVALYYDRAPVEYRFHFTTSDYGFNSDNVRYNIRSQWGDFVSLSDLYNYSGNDAEHLALKNELINKTGEYVAVGKHAKVKVVNDNHSVVANTTIDYGGVNGTRYRTISVNSNNSSVKFGTTIYYQSLYGAPAVFSSDNSSLIPYWYCYMGKSDPEILQRYIIGGSTAYGGATYYNDFSLQYFADISTDTASLSKDLYPYYPPANSGSTIFYLEVAPSDEPSWTNLRTDASQNVTRNMFKNAPDINSVGKATNGDVVFWRNGAIRVFVDGYTTYAYALDDGTLRTDIPDRAGSNSRNITIYLMRNTYTMSFVDTSLRAGTNYPTSYLYKQEIPRLPRADEIVSPGDDYIFDGWYTSSAYAVKIAGADGVIDDGYKALESTLLDSNGNLLMNCENIQVFAKWAPKHCIITFNPFYPDARFYGIDNRLTVSPNPVDYGSTIATLPDVLPPQGTIYADRDIIEEDDEIFYVQKNAAGAPILKYKFLGWYKYTGFDTPSSMEDLVVQFVPGTDASAGATQVTDHTVLYAKWQQVLGEAIYTIVCLDYSNGGEEIFSVQRSGTAGETVTIAPPAFDDPTDKDVKITKGKYEDLKEYEALSNAITRTLTSGMTFKFRYRKSIDWTYTVKNVLHVGEKGVGKGIDILINSTDYKTTYNQVQFAASDLEGYSIYEYQIAEEDPIVKTDTSGYIPIEKPEDSDVLEITVRYTLDDGVVIAKNKTTDYYQYDPVDLADVPEGVFDWADTVYKPAIIYTINGKETYEIIERAEESGDSTAVIKTISETNPGSYEVTMKIGAVSSTEPLTYLALSDIGKTDVSIKKSAHALRFTFDAEDPTSTAQIYYAFAGSHAGYWYWDKELNYRIGADGDSIVSADISALTGDVLANAQKILDGINATYDQQTSEYKSFFVIVGTDAYTVVDRHGNLRNGAMLNNDLVAHVESSTETDNAYEIKLYDTTGAVIGSVIVYL
ncbi:MAG: prepilin-type N-terminal cleavage/methylation domain-containing protein [Butyrivibrio sp.]|nr:prepilin-type N-terminal cleavage/methylation domain-containing protein [Butyrivibrio sp.]